VKRAKLQVGDRVFINTLRATKERIGANNDMKSLIGNFIYIHKLSHRFNQAIKIIHPASEETYTIHCNDISLEPILKDKRKIIKVEHVIKSKFDINTLSV